MSADRIGTGHLTDAQLIADVERQIEYILTGPDTFPLLAPSNEIGDALLQLLGAVNHGGDVDAAVRVVREALAELVG